MNDSSSPAHFGRYEMMRIFIPGFFIIFIAYVYIASFSLSAYPFDTWEIGVPTFFIGALIAGLTFYAKESPKKRKAFQTNRPSEYILERSRELKASPAMTEDEAKRMYFYILNRYMPASFHEKIFFFGMIYHVMISIRRTSFWFGVAGICLIIERYVTAGHILPETMLSVVLVWFVYALNVRYNKADRKIQENYLDQIFWLKMNDQLVSEVLTTGADASRPQ
jgi:hypothetical protein